MKRTDFYCEEELYEWVKEKAKENHMSFSMMLRQILWERKNAEEHLKNLNKK